MSEQGWAPHGGPSGAYAYPPAAQFGQPPNTAPACYACGRQWGPGIACQFCRQVAGMPSGVHIASAGKRLGGYLLEGVLLIFTAVIGWIIWAAIVFQDGQTPAKQVLGMRCATLRDNRAASWGRMFLREAVAKPVIGILSWVTLGIVNFWLVWDTNTQELWDKMVGTIVVNDPHGLLLPRTVPALPPVAVSPPPAPPAAAVPASEPRSAPPSSAGKAAPVKAAKKTPAKAATTKPATAAKKAPAPGKRVPAKSRKQVPAKVGKQVPAKVGKQVPAKAARKAPSKAADKPPARRTG